MKLWFVNEFHIQILALELLLCRNMPRRNGFWLRLLPLCAVYLVLPLLVPGGFGTSFLQISNGFSFSFPIMIVLSALILWACFEISPKQLVFCCCVAHTLQHMIHCLSRVIWFLLPIGDIASQIVEIVLMLAGVGLLYWFLKKNNRTFGIESVELKNAQLILFAVVSSITVYFVSVLSNWNEGNNVGEQFFDFFSCALLLVILLDLFRFRKAEQEQTLLNRLLKQEQEQHEMSRATVEVINRKCHDLKHQISALRHQSEADQEKSIAELEHAILLYDNLAKTGNNDLDIVLAEKTFLAEKHGVKLQCIVDGERFSFMRTEDICSLFGNAIDNAIEAATKEPAAEKRIVMLRTSMKGNMLSLHVENPCSQKPQFADGLPLTSKGDTDYHGFGMRSMRYVAEKYGGVLTAAWEDGFFSLDVLFLQN